MKLVATIALVVVAATAGVWGTSALEEQALSCDTNNVCTSDKLTLFKSDTKLLDSLLSSPAEWSYKVFSTALCPAETTRDPQFAPLFVVAANKTQTEARLFLSQPDLNSWVQVNLSNVMPLVANSRFAFS